jgi:RNA polymerase sigma-70 factor (ECF subfamily)
MDSLEQRRYAEARFAEVFACLGAVTAYARRRGAPDPEEIAAETMAIAWRKLSEVPADDPRPWLFATARNTVFADRRRRVRQAESSVREQPATLLEPDLFEGAAAVDSELADALQTLPPADREALLLVAWDDLTPALAAASLGISPAAFRVRLYRARLRCRRALELSARHRAELADPTTPTLEQP